MPWNPSLPPPVPTISGSVLSVDAFLANPTRVTRVINDLTAQRFIADRMLGQGPNAPSGAIVYDQVTASDLYLSADVEEIRPGAAFPELTDTSPTPKVAAVAKYGGQITITREAINRNRTDVLARELTKLRNTVVRKVNAVAIAAATAAPKQTAAGVDISASTAEQVIAMFATVKGLIDNLDMGYDADLVLLNPVQGDEMLSKSALVTLLQNDGPGSGGGSPLRTGNLGRILDMDFQKSNDVAVGTLWVIASGALGGISQEEGSGVLTNVYATDRSGPKDQHVQAWRPIVPYITDPKASVLVSGV